MPRRLFSRPLLARRASFPLPSWLRPLLLFCGPTRVPPTYVITIHIKLRTSTMWLTILPIDLGFRHCGIGSQLWERRQAQGPVSSEGLWERCQNLQLSRLLETTQSMKMPTWYPVGGSIYVNEDGYDGGWNSGRSRKRVETYFEHINTPLMILINLFKETKTYPPVTIPYWHWGFFTILFRRPTVHIPPTSEGQVWHTMWKTVPRVWIKGPGHPTSKCQPRWAGWPYTCSIIKGFNRLRGRREGLHFILQANTIDSDYCKYQVGLMVI